MANKWRRRNYFPYPKFQTRFLIFLSLGALVQILATSFILYYFLRQNYLLLVKYAGLDETITSILYGELRFMCAAVGFTFVVYLFGLVGLGLLFSHRIAGPIVALKRTIKAINAGQPSELRFRDTDEWHDVADEFNRMVATLRAKGEGSRANEA